MVDPVVAIAAAIVAILATFTVFAKNPISSAFSLVVAMVGLAAIYGMSGAHFVAALQVVVYAGAIMVLFVFSIMLLNMNEEQSEIKKGSWKTWAAALVCFAVFLGLASTFLAWDRFEGKPLPGLMTLEQIRAVGGNVKAVSGSLFSQGFIQFEFISLLLLVAIASALVLAKRKVD